MLQHGFDMHRVFPSAPGDLERERDACRSVISEVNAAAAMPLKILLVTVGLSSDDQIVGFRSPVAENIRQCAYYLQVFEDDWGPKNLFRKMFFLATECRDDAALPMQEVVVFLKAAPRETDPEILAFRKELEQQVAGVGPSDCRAGAFTRLILVSLYPVWRDWRTAPRTAAPDTAMSRRRPSPGSPSLCAGRASRSAGCPRWPRRPSPSRRLEQRSDSSVVFLKDDLLAIEAQAFQDGSHIIHHRFQAADVNI
jgi:hypothetical protein